MTSGWVKCAVLAATAAGAMASVCGTAGAADLGAGKFDPHRPISPVPVWHGFYLGANLGYGWSRVAAEADPARIHGEGIIGGVHGGFNWQRGLLVVGAEGDYGRSAVRGSTVFGPDTLAVQHRHLGSVRARVGLAADRVLYFGTVGYGWGQTRFVAEDAVTRAQRDTTSGGLVYGTGVEYKLRPDLSIRAEALRFDLSERWTVAPGTRVRIDAPVTEARIGLTWHIGGLR